MILRPPRVSATGAGGGGRLGGLGSACVLPKCLPPAFEQVLEGRRPFGVLPKIREGLLLASSRLGRHTSTTSSCPSLSLGSALVSSSSSSSVRRIRIVAHLPMRRPRALPLYLWITLLRYFGILSGPGPSVPPKGIGTALEVFPHGAVAGAGAGRCCRMVRGGSSTRILPVVLAVAAAPPGRRMGIIGCPGRGVASRLRDEMGRQCM
jgi:hypothetical protein